MSTPNFYMVKEEGRGVAEHYVEVLSDAEDLAKSLARKNIGTTYVVLAPIEAFQAVAINIEEVIIDRSDGVNVNVTVPVA